MENHSETPTNQSLVGSLLFPHPHMPGIRADVLGEINSWPISNTVTFMWFITLLFFVFFFVTKKFKEVPTFFQSLVELFLEGIEGLINSLTGGRAHRNLELLYPIAAIFMIVGTINILGSFPIINQFIWAEGGHLLPLFRKATSDINVTFPLALVIVLSMQFFGVKNWGFFGYVKRFFPLHLVWAGAKKGVGEFFLSLIELFVGLLELVSEMVKVVSLSLRLFGNMFAGEILLAILTGIFAVALPAVWLGFDFMVAVIQTVVIGCLTAVYYVLVVKEEGQEGH
jgi:F-type H+-transporting ATPase subunit a